MPEVATLAGLRARRPEAIGEAADRRRRPRAQRRQHRRGDPRGDEPADAAAGGEVADDQDATFASWQRALEAPGVIGLVVGRSLLYPPDDDVAAAVDTAAALLKGAPACT